MDSSNLIETTNQEDDIRVEEHEVNVVEDIVLDGNDGAQPNEHMNIDGEEDIEKGNNEEESEGDDVEENKDHFERKKRKRSSKAHADFTEVSLDDGKKKFQCIHCKALLSKPLSGTTSHLWNHLKRCLQNNAHKEKQKKLLFLPANSNSKFEISPLSDGRYDHAKQREAVAHWILMNEQPLNVVENYGFTLMLSINQPQFEKISRVTAKRDVTNVYEIEKKRLHLMLKDVNKISLTTDIWKSKVQKISYMCVTGHFIDSQWQLHKRLLSFLPLPPPHAGVDIYDGLIKCTRDWGIEHKIFTISVDNASNNDVAIQIAKETFSKSRKLPLEGVDYPTSNVYLAVIWRVKHVLNEKENHVDEYMKLMIAKMKKKFDKYWGCCNLLMAIGAILDPRFKMRLVDFAFYKIYNEVDARANVMKVRDALYSLYFEYVEVDHAKSRKDITGQGPCSQAKSFHGKFVPSGLSMFDDYLNAVEVDGPSKSELDIYLEEGVYRCSDGDVNVATNFDALAWWKSQELKFKVLSKLARDVLAIPISTVASEATFSAGTRVLDPYRSRLSSDMVEILICGADWVRQLHGIKKPIMTHEEEEPFHVNLQT